MEAGVVCKNILVKSLKRERLEMFTQFSFDDVTRRALELLTSFHVAQDLITSTVRRHSKWIIRRHLYPFVIYVEQMCIVVYVRVNVLNFPHVTNGLFGLTARQCCARSGQHDDEKAEGSVEAKAKTNHDENEIKINAKITELVKPFFFFRFHVALRPPKPTHTRPKITALNAHSDEWFATFINFFHSRVWRFCRLHLSDWRAHSLPVPISFWLMWLTYIHIQLTAVIRIASRNEIFMPGFGGREEMWRRKMKTMR